MPLLAADENDTNDFTSTTVTVNEPTVGTAPAVNACNPSSGSRADRFTVTVDGSNFQNGATVSFGRQIKIRGVLFVSSSKLDVEIEIHKKAPSGTRDVTVTNPDGQSGTMAACFTVN